MLGLIFKDFICMKKTSLKLFVFFIVYFIIFTSTGNISFLSAMIIMLSTMFVITTFAYDEVAKWDCFALSLPVTKKQVVLSKYLLAVIFDVMGILVVFIIHVIKNRLIYEELISIYALAAVALIIVSILIPLIYKFGTQKSRIWLIVIFLVPTALAALFSKSGLASNFSLPSESTIETLVKASLPFAIIIFALSYFISCHIYENSEV